MRSKLQTIGIIILLIVLSVLCADGSPPGVRTNVTITSDYPTNELSTNLWFKVYSSTNLSISHTNWPLIATVPGTNATFTLPLDYAQRFYVAKSSNSWWRTESDFSNTCGTEPLPQGVVRLRIDFSAP